MVSWSTPAVRQFTTAFQSNVTVEAQAWHWIPAAGAGLFIDPGVGKLEPCGVFRCEYVYKAEERAYVERVKLYWIGDVGNIGLAVRGLPRRLWVLPVATPILSPHILEPVKVFSFKPILRLRKCG